jgi:hypothetical protein
MAKYTVLMEWCLAAEVELTEETCPSVILLAANPTSAALELNPDLSGENRRPVPEF